MSEGSKYEVLDKVPILGLVQMDRYPRSSMLEAPKVQWIGW
jgi:hypothetical protein